MEDNLQAFNPGQWVDQYADVLYSYTLTRVKDVQAAEDIVQNTFLSAWKGRDTYKGQASEKNWLYAICKNKIIDHFRKVSVSPVLLAANEEDHYFGPDDHWKRETKPADWGSYFEQPAERREFYQVLNQCRQKLKDVQQSVFAMKYMEELESDEICRVLGITPANYWVLIHRAKLQLRKCLEKNWIGIN